VQSPLLQAETKGCLEHPQAVGHAATEIDGRGILEIPGGAGQKLALQEFPGERTHREIENVSSVKGSRTASK